ncbi:lysylphosphatidylglycerol synthase domain-containing protein [Achromobacter sp. F4_2707]|uniref:lysylphosphatidylglycerol synthase domain-containing protein n=1 Tax=Achromobacter sp. F4_2707 TaxID=3114286 RepID=UPI0039C66D38
MRALTTARRWFGRHKAKLKRVATGVFVCFIIALLIRVGLTIEWSEVMQAILETPRSSLWMAVPLVAASYVLYSCFDLLGRRYVGHDVAWWRTMLVAFISYAFTMNFSAAVGGLALRLRLYGKHGLDPGQIMRIMGLSITTNWMGYCLLAGGIFAAGAVQPPSDWEISTGPLRVIGVLMVFVAVGYLALCAFSTRRSWTVRDHKIVLPEARIAVLQLVLAMMNWSVMGWVVYTVMPGDIGYAAILGTLLIGSIVGAVAHIPGGLGVTEYVFITMLAPEVPRHQVLGAILVYRALYYLAPVLLAGICYLILETRSSSTMSRGTKIA